MLSCYQGQVLPRQDEPFHGIESCPVPYPLMHLQLFLLVGQAANVAAPGSTIRGIAAPPTATTIRPATATTTTVFV